MLQRAVKGLLHTVDKLAAQRRILQSAVTLFPAQAGQLRPARMIDKRMNRALPAHQNAGGPSAHRANQRQALFARFVQTAHKCLPQVGRVIGLHQCKRHRPAGFPGELGHPLRQFIVHLHMVGRHLKHAMAGITHGLANTEQLVTRGKSPWRIFAPVIVVDQGAAGGKTQRTGFQAILDNGHHGFDIFTSGAIMGHATLAHYIGAHGRVRNLGADVECVFAPIECVEILRESFPIPLNAFGQH